MAENANTPAADSTPAADAAPDTGGLLANVTPTAPDATPADPDKSDIAHIADDPGKKTAEAVAKGVRPAYIPEKFWDKEKGEVLHEQMAKSYAEMEKNFKNGKHKAPDEGKYDTTALTSKGVPAEDPLVKEYTGWAAKYGIPQAAYDELAGKVLEMAGENAGQVEVSKKEETAKLGEQAPAIIDSMVGWARSLVSSGAWTAEDFEEFKVMGGTANGMRALMRLRESYEGRIPLKETIPGDIGLSDEELHARVGDPKYQTNEGGFRDKTERLFELRYGGQQRAA